MMRAWVLISALFASSATSFAQAPPPEVFQVLPALSKPSPSITPYLKYQTEMAWDQDARRHEAWLKIRTEQDLIRVQDQIRRSMLSMLGGLPEQHPPLHSRISGSVKMSGFHIEKLIYESLPKIYVTALVYVPDDGKKKHPALLVPAGHAAKGKFYYQSLCQRLVQRGYVVIAWDPVGQGERSQFWDKSSGKSRYNLICAEHAVMGNLAYLAGTNLARWEIWDGVRAVDYLLTRDDVDPERISITGSSGGGTQTAYIAAVDRRIKVAAPSCYITALPMRVYNRIFKDPDSDPEQDLYGMISNGVDHPGLLLLMYPRPVFVASAVLDFFPIEGTHKTVREVERLYSMFGHSDRIAMHEGYHDHQYSPENQEAAMEFLDHFNGLPARHELAPVKELDEQTLQVTKSGQVMLEFEDARSIMDEIHDYYLAHKGAQHPTLRELYYSSEHPDIAKWSLGDYKGAQPASNEILVESAGSSEHGDAVIDRYLLHHSRYLEMPLLRIHRKGVKGRPLLWLGENGKATAQDWPKIEKQLAAGFDVITFDPRGLGETRMNYKAESPDDPALAKMSFDEAYVSPISGVLADYIYNSVLTGRPYLLQVMEDIEIASRVSRERLSPGQELSITGTGVSSSIASFASEVLPNLPTQSTPAPARWSEIVEQKRELWPVQLLLPGGAYIH